MKAGRLRDGIEIQAPTRSTDAGGGKVLSWATVTNGARMAEIRPMSGAESYVAAQLQGIVTHKVTTRYLAGITNKHRVVVTADSRILDVHQVIDWDNRHVEISMICTQREATD